ncbi:helix-turn-helix domain-containing protein [Streptomyces sp. NPDC002133]|uniref:helix-turn-helix domain-containing protein n=1 Tax=Streptomyces sp. NPDC002133 TaxID=3154409 RepID=UPI0033271526
MCPRHDLGGRRRTSTGVRPAGHDGRGPEAAAAQPDREGPGPAAPGDRGADVHPGPDGQGHHLTETGGEDFVREVIHALNERGVRRPGPKWSGGRPKTINDEVREHICLIARTSPADWKITAFSTWSLSKLAEHLIQQKVTPAIGRETLRRIMRAGKTSWKTTTTWKASTEPEFIAKMHRVLALYDTRRRTGG